MSILKAWIGKKVEVLTLIAASGALPAAERIKGVLIDFDKDGILLKTEQSQETYINKSLVYAVNQIE